jgi:hypothetical protein
LVSDPRHNVIELYDGNKGRELLEKDGGAVPTLSFDRDNWNVLKEFLFIFQ